jgi:hypothetical protein
VTSSQSDQRKETNSTKNLAFLLTSSQSVQYKEEEEEEEEGKEE